ncbi:MAG TPA: hypothetical protein VNP91_06900 [Methylomirabilota bacterium]|nr:hypothetical protein [Methylomirabilota bacterium]
MIVAEGIVAHHGTLSGEKGSRQETTSSAGKPPPQHPREHDEENTEHDAQQARGEEIAPREDLRGTEEVGGHRGPMPDHLILVQADASAGGEVADEQRRSLIMGRNEQSGQIEALSEIDGRDER